jgi:hypothetical protein
MRKTSSKSKKRTKPKAASPPPVVDGARVLAFANVDKSVAFTDSGSLLVDGKPLGKVPCLAICEADDGAVLLMFCDKKWSSLGVVGCASLARAKTRAEQDYVGISRKWIKASVTRRAAKQYLESLYRNQRCSFCGRTPLEVGQIIGGREARICDLCVRDLAESVGLSGKAA